MTQLQEFLFSLSFHELRLIQSYMLKRYKVYCGSLHKLEQTINDYIPDEDVLEELYEVIS